MTEQPSLFPSDLPAAPPLPGGFGLKRAWMPAPQADRLFQDLLEGIAWEQKQLRVWGKPVLTPRLIAWYGPRAYPFSGSVQQPSPWPPALEGLRDRLSAELGAGLNSCMANLYRDGADSVGWHADDDPVFGDRPTIASLSLGQERDFLIRERGTGQRIRIPLAHGDVLVMEGSSQRLWEHSVPPRARATQPRINLTFRTMPLI